MALSLYLYEFGKLRQTRYRFARELSRQHAFREAWLRSLALEIKR